MEQVDDRPKWLLELENRRRKPHLAHEAGAGAPCLSCNTACPGLDLHFWRKICKNCKCSRDDHDVDDDEFPQFQLLFGPSSKSKNRPMRLCVNKKHQENEATFEWVPPGTTKELAADYMKALPVDKQPIKGSVGAALRKQQLQKQLPLHDIDHKACSELNDQEKKEFEQYLENLKSSVGQGKVTQSMGARPFHRSLMTPANATDVKRSSPQHKQTPSQGINLRTPSSFIPKLSPPLPRNDENLAQSSLISSRVPNLESSSEFGSTPGRYSRALAKSLYDKYVADVDPVTGMSPQFSSDPRKLGQNKTGRRDEDLESSNDVNSTPGRYHRALSKFGHGDNVVDVDPVTEMLKSPQFSSDLSKLNRNKIGNDENSQSKNGDFFAEKLPAAQEYGSERLGAPLSNIESSSEAAMLAEQMLSEALLPPSAIHTDSIVGSTLDSKGLMYIREKLNSKYGSAQEEFLKGNGIADSAVWSNAGKKNREPWAANPQSSFHHLETESAIPQESLLEDRARAPAHFARDIECKTKPYSSPEQSQIAPLRVEINTSHNAPSSVVFSEELRNPVFPEEMIGSNPRDQIQNAVDEMQENMEALAVNATEKQRCHKCQGSINVGDVVVMAEKADDAVWHPGCFACSACNELFADLVYFYHKGKLYCGRDLATLLEIPRCFACDELIFVRKYTVAEGHSYHLNHFCCWDCDVPLGGQKYTPENDRPLCLSCYQNNYAKICKACSKAIAADHQSVAVKELDFHATDECFCCFECRKSLFNGRMAIKENKLFCSKECIAEFLNHNR